MKDLTTSMRLVALSMFVCCVLYTGAMLAFGQIIVPDKANGSMLKNADGNLIGSERIAQEFERPEYFWPRPSAVDYDASATGGSNKSPTNPELTQRAKETIAAYGLRDGERIPADLVAASGGGIDPHITQAAAKFQTPRVLAVRPGLSQARIEELIKENSEMPILSVFGGEPLVNVLKLNIALDEEASRLQAVRETAGGKR